jgi:hypothetical protein|mmetsp:Transcript_19680/g.28435  ORF Transcript_19680/g.28435 Transcript_19680/m.28435 type:complete len:214 (-) Transcript_19680:491-1132(-)|eukprot:CAMPEP_0113934516 /NCGR_PEP_ID=MMETSP1339-20121228/1815_1 /TAXON_ID=94617 /ORGANISM="Fibrocapsa japonica" /LENGTH=213 /DNA_ID=CAMNT_0000936359 /DNA_START=133 /DNA_END=774 /DNA_ORIENTATION=+ /assembly_acc=CAM_ASM_000762
MYAKIVALAAVAGMASAFVPAMPVAGVAKSSSSMQMSYANELGAQAPLGFFDPLGMLKNADQERFNRLRYVEIKHGRIAMLAVLGHIVTAAGVRFPGYLSTTENVLFTDVPAGLAAWSKVPAGGIFQIIGFIGAMECQVMLQREGSFPGDMCNPAPPKAWDNFSDQTKLRKRAVELNNGRAAMMGILGLMVHEKLNNDPYVINSLLGAPVPFN